VAHRLHHGAICVDDVEASLRFYRDGLGLAVLVDQVFEGDWPALFGAPSRSLRSVMLGDPARPDAGIVELVVFGGVGPDHAGSAGSEVVSTSPSPPPRRGFFLLSFFVDVPATLTRLAALGYHQVRRIEQPGPRGPVLMATVYDPNGVLVELIGA